MAYEDFNHQQPRYMNSQTQQGNPYGLPQPQWAPQAPWGAPTATAGPPAATGPATNFGDIVRNTTGQPAAGGGTIVPPMQPPNDPNNPADYAYGGTVYDNPQVNTSGGTIAPPPASVNPPPPEPTGVTPGQRLADRGITDPSQLRLWDRYTQARQAGRGTEFLAGRGNFATNLNALTGNIGASSTHPEVLGPPPVSPEAGQPPSGTASDAPGNMETVAPNSQIPRPAAPPPPTPTQQPPRPITATLRPSGGMNQASRRGGIGKRRGGMMGRGGPSIGTSRPGRRVRRRRRR